MIVHCQLCGTAFDDGHKEVIHGSHRQLCDDCRRHNETARHRRSRAKRQAQAARPIVSVSEKSAEADRRGLSYGKLVILEMQAAARRAKA